jgi:pyrroloquinoline quinone (PQQ) biosynthesis protein C
MSEDVRTLIDREIERLQLNDNAFYRSFRRRPLSLEDLTFVCQQYYYYIRTFPQILAGLSHRVESEAVRVQLARTVVSELGDGHGLAHFQLFEKAIAAVGVTLEPYTEVDYIDEAAGLVAGLRRIFLDESPVAAVGGHYTIEETGFPMLDSLYEGFRLYPGGTARSMEYFHLHLFLESDHVSWISTAVAAFAEDPRNRPDLVRGGIEVAGLLARFWEGLERHTYGRSVGALAAR